MYSMKEACALTEMSYENLKFYCNEGLVPHVMHGYPAPDGLRFLLRTD